MGEGKGRKWRAGYKSLISFSLQNINGPEERKIFFETDKESVDGVFREQMAGIIIKRGRVHLLRHTLVHASRPVVSHNISYTTPQYIRADLGVVSYRIRTSLSTGLS
jgi:hypothetical protein